MRKSNRKIVFALPLAASILANTVWAQSLETGDSQSSEYQIEFYQSSEGQALSLAPRRTPAIPTNSAGIPFCIFVCNASGQ